MPINRVKQLKKIQKEALKLFKKKNADYGDAFATYGVVGVFVRIGDKLNRMASIDRNQIVMVTDETMKDTLIDLHNYSAMAMMLIEEHEKREQEDYDTPDVFYGSASGTSPTETLAYLIEDGRDDNSTNRG